MKSTEEILHRIYLTISYQINMDMMQNIFPNRGQNHQRPAMVPYKTLNDGNKMPILAFGTYVQERDIGKLREIVVWAIQMGYRHIDMAAMYNNEESIGKGIRDVTTVRNIVSRQQLFVTTKLHPEKHARDQVVPALKESLSRLGLHYVDLFLIHSPQSPNNIDYTDTWQGMEEAKKLGLTRSIGISNFNEEQLERLLSNSKILPAVNQVEINPTSTRESLVNHCHSYNIAVMAYSPLGYLVDRGRWDAPPPRMDDPVLKEIADKYGKSTVQIVLRYLIDRGTIPIPKSVHKRHLRENIDVFDFTLTPEEVATISKFNKDQPIFGWQ